MVRSKYMYLVLFSSIYSLIQRRFEQDYKNIQSENVDEEIMVKERLT